MGEFVGNLYAPDFLRVAGLSVHAMVTPSGVVIRCRGDAEGAYHAAGHNQYSLGVEVLVPGKHTYETFLEKIKTDWVAPAQFAATVALVREWRKIPGIVEFKRHCDTDPGRKLDPGAGFMWERFLKEIAN